MPKRRPLRFVLDNLSWLLGSLGLAVIVWYAAVSGTDPVEQKTLTVQNPIEIQVHEGLVVVNRPQPAVVVTVRGLRSVVSELDARSVSLSADMADREARITPYSVVLVGRLRDVRGAAVVAVQPEKITVEIAQRAEQLVPVEVRFSQDPPVGYIARARPSESTVRVSGPDWKVAQVRGVVARVGVQDQRETFNRFVTLQAVDENGSAVSDVQLTPGEMLITIEIQQRSDVTELAVAPRFVGELPTGYLRANQSWQPRRIVVRGVQSIIDRLGGVIYTEPIDLTDRRETFTDTVKLDLPFGVEMPDPTDIRVTVNIEPVPGSRDFVGIPVQKRGLDPADYDVTIRPDRVNVTVTGPQVVINTLTPNDITVYAALNGFALGNHQVTLQASITKAGIEGVSVNILTGNVDVTITARNPTTTPSPDPMETPPSPTESATP